MIVKSRKRSGFTLIEVIISMMIIGILSVGIFGSYLMLIRHTKAGEEKQQSMLIGKTISEEIKNSTNNIQKINDHNIKLTDDIILDNKNEKEVFKKEVFFDSKGEVLKNMDSKGEVPENMDSKGEVPENMDSKGEVPENMTKAYYKAFVKIEPENTKKGNEIKISKEDYDKRLFVGNTIDSNEEVIKGQDIGKVERKIKIDITSQSMGNIKLENSGDIEKNIGGEAIVLDFKYVNSDSNFTIDVNNETGNPFKLFILNSKRDERSGCIKVNNKKGILYEYYRHDYEKTGRLYKITLEIYKNGDLSNDKPLFETKFVQNINVD